MYFLLGVGGHLLSGEMGDLLYTVFRYVRKWEMAEEVTGGVLMVGALEMAPAQRNMSVVNIITPTHSALVGIGDKGALVGMAALIMKQVKCCQKIKSVGAHVDKGVGGLCWHNFEHNK